MTINVAINGYGRIGRNILRAHYEGGKQHDIRIVAINDLGKPETNAHLTRHDTAHGPFPGSVVARTGPAGPPPGYPARAPPRTPSRARSNSVRSS